MIAIVLYLAFHQQPGDAEALVRTAPADISLERARVHVAAAELAGAVYAIDPNLLLSIAHHESRYQITAVTAEVTGVSCGVMTPEPRRQCPAPDLLGGYLAGAAHLSTWRTACRGDLACALTGYAGGYRLLDLCRHEHVHACDTWRVFLGRARWIARERERGSS